MKLGSGLVIQAIPNWSELEKDQKAFITSWIEALRSGEYPQTRHTLRSFGDGYCCLGVAADLEVKAGQGQWEKNTTSDITVNVFKPVDVEGFFGKGFDSCLPETTARKYGMPSGYGLYVSVDKHTWPEITTEDGEKIRHGLFDASLADLNDNGNATFLEIAEILERALKGGYFVDGVTEVEANKFDGNMQRVNRTPPILRA
jgi:hypothetical protein